MNYGPYTGYFLWSFALGIALALVYDFLRFLRKIIKTNDFIVNMQDIIFIIMSGGCMVCTAYFTNNGELRFYGVLGSVLGFVLYRKIVGRRLVDGMSLVWRIFCRGINLLIGAIMLPFRMIVRAVGKPIIITIGAAAKKVRRKIRRKFVKMPK